MQALASHDSTPTSAAPERPNVVSSRGTAVHESEAARVDVVRGQGKGGLLLQGGFVAYWVGVLTGEHPPLRLLGCCFCNSFLSPRIGTSLSCMLPTNSWLIVFKQMLARIPVIIFARDARYLHALLPGLCNRDIAHLRQFTSFPNATSCRPRKHNMSLCQPVALPLHCSSAVGPGLRLLSGGISARGTCWSGFCSAGSAYPHAFPG